MRRHARARRENSRRKWNGLSPACPAAAVEVDRLAANARRSTARSPPRGDDRAGLAIDGVSRGRSPPRRTARPGIWPASSRPSIAAALCRRLRQFAEHHQFGERRYPTAPPESASPTPADPPVPAPERTTGIRRRPGDVRGCRHSRRRGGRSSASRLPVRNCVPACGSRNCRAAHRRLNARYVLQGMTHHAAGQSSDSR